MSRGSERSAVCLSCIKLDTAAERALATPTEGQGENALTQLLFYGSEAQNGWQTASGHMSYLLDTLKIGGIMNHEPDQFPLERIGGSVVLDGSRLR